MPLRSATILSDRQMARLTAEQGCAIVYTHFGKGFVTEKAGRYIIEDRVKRQLRSIAGHADGWYAPACEILDRLLAFQKIESFPVPAGIVLANHNSFGVSNVTLRGVPKQRYRDLGLGCSFTADAQGVIVLPMLPAEGIVALVPEDIAGNHWLAPENRSLFWRDCRTAVQKLQDRWLGNA